MTDDHEQEPEATEAERSSDDLTAGLEAARVTKGRVPRRRTLFHLASWVVPPTPRTVNLLRRYLFLRWSGGFNADWYLRTNRDVAAAGVDPLLHYIEHGLREGRSPAPSHWQVPEGRSRYRPARGPRRAAEHRSNTGYCVICEDDTVFIEMDSYLRDHYRCDRCGSIPRNRALVNALNVFCPEWKNLVMHESSPSGPLSDYLKSNVTKYTASQYYPDVPKGHYEGDMRSEDLSRLTFESDVFDLLITSDVFEHVIEPAAAFKEIARVLKPGGMHVFTMPYYPSIETSVQRAQLVGNEVVLLEEAVHHQNPISEEGSLVTYDWGRDFPFLVWEFSALVTTIFVARDRSLGLDGEFLEVFISRKMHELADARFGSG